MQNEDVLWLARLLLSHHAPDVSDSLAAAQAADSTTPHRHVLTTPVALRNTYETVEVRSDTLYVWRDAYRRKTTTIPRILSRLSAVGFDTTRVNQPMLRRVVARSATRDQRFALADLREP
jgi:hypothetical protein